MGGKRKCKESKGGESREVANCHWSTFPGNRRSLKLGFWGGGPMLLTARVSNRGHVLGVGILLPARRYWGGRKS